MTPRRATALIALLSGTIALAAKAEENLYQKRDRLKARYSEIERESKALLAKGQDKLEARRQLTQAQLKTTDEYFIQTFAMGVSVTVDHLLPSGGTLAKNVLRKIVAGDRHGRFTDAQRERRRIIREMDLSIADLERESAAIVARLESLKRELDDVIAELKRLNQVIEDGPPTSGKKSGSRTAAAQEEDSPESLVPALTRYFTAYMEGGQGNYRIEYTRDWNYDAAKKHFTCNYRLWRIRPHPGQSQRPFREYVESANENPLRPVTVTLSGARQIVRAGKWLR